MMRRGRKRRLGIEDEYWELIRAGVGTVEACTAVGVGRKTGYRGELKMVARPRSDCLRLHILAGFCRCLSGNGSQYWQARVARSGRSRSDWTGQHPRSVESCGATGSLTTVAPMTVTWPMPVHAVERADRRRDV